MVLARCQFVLVSAHGFSSRIHSAAQSSQLCPRYEMLRGRTHDVPILAASCRRSHHSRLYEGDQSFTAEQYLASPNMALRILHSSSITLYCTSCQQVGRAGTGLVGRRVELHFHIRFGHLINLPTIVPTGLGWYDCGMSTPNFWRRIYWFTPGPFQKGVRDDPRK